MLFFLSSPYRPALQERDNKSLHPLSPLSAMFGQRHGLGHLLYIEPTIYYLLMFSIWSERSLIQPHKEEGRGRLLYPILLCLASFVHSNHPGTNYKRKKEQRKAVLFSQAILKSYWLLCLYFVMLHGLWMLVITFSLRQCVAPCRRGWGLVMVPPSIWHSSARRGQWTKERHATTSQLATFHFLFL